jgi:hypothetical protein
MGGTKEKNLKTPKSVKCPASISENPVPLCEMLIKIKEYLQNFITYIEDNNVLSFYRSKMILERPNNVG